MKAILRFNPDATPGRLMISLEAQPRILTASLENREPATASLLLAFAADPAVRWMYPDPHHYRTFFPRFVRAFAGQAFALGTARYVEGFRGTSLWLPPGVLPDDAALGPLLVETVDPARQGDLFAILEQMGAAHPAQPHWYLPLIGVDPRCQRQGLGAALLAPMLASFDRDPVLAYLESTNPENLPFYQRHGFRVTAEIRSGSSPTIFAMVREAQ